MARCASHAPSTVTAGASDRSMRSDSGSRSSEGRARGPAVDRAERSRRRCRPSRTRPSMPRIAGELLAGARRALHDARERELGEHVAGRHVERFGGAFPPRRDLLRDTARPAAQLARALDAPPRGLRDRAGCARVCRRSSHSSSAHSSRPTASSRSTSSSCSASRCSTSAAAYDALLGAQRPARPVGQPVALREPDAEQPLDERGERRRAEADEAGRDLRVEQLRRAGAARPLEDREVLSAACATMQPAPASSSPSGAGSTASGSTSAMPSGHAIWISASRGQYERSPWNSVSSAYRGSSASAATSSASAAGRRRSRRGSTPTACLRAGWHDRCAATAARGAHLGEAASKRPQHLGLVVGEVADDDVGAARLAPARRSASATAAGAARPRAPTGRSRGSRARGSARRPARRRRRRRRRGRRGAPRCVVGVAAVPGARLAVRPHELPRPRAGVASGPMRNASPSRAARSIAGGAAAPIHTSSGSGGTGAMCARSIAHGASIDTSSPRTSGGSTSSAASKRDARARAATCRTRGTARRRRRPRTA